MDRKRTFENPNTETAPAFSSHAEIEHHVAQAQKLRAEATARMLSEAGRGVARLLRPSLAALVRWQQRRATRDALMHCSDRVLADIGIEREHIPLIARGIDAAEYQLRDPALRRWWHAARARLDAARQAGRERRRIYRELMAYSDRDLEEIGLRRADIPAIACGHPVLQPAE